MASPAHSVPLPGSLTGLLSGRAVSSQSLLRLSEAGERHGFHYVQGEAVRIDPVRRHVVFRDGRDLRYDLLSCAVGGIVPDLPGQKAPLTSLPVFPARPVPALLEGRDAVADRLDRGRSARIAVIGGGPSAVEIAGALWVLLCDLNPGIMPDITIFPGRCLLKDKPEARLHALRSLKARNIHIAEGGHVSSVDFGEDGSLRLVIGNRAKFETDLVFLATGVRPSPLFRDSGLPVADDGGLLVNDQLQCALHREIFGGGDCVTVLRHDAMIRDCGQALQHGDILAANLLNALKGKSLIPWRSHPARMRLYSLGDGTAILSRGTLAFRNRLFQFMRDLRDVRRSSGFAPPARQNRDSHSDN